MITIEKIKSDFSYIEAMSGSSETYHDSPVFEGFGAFCDLYLRAKDKQLKQEQVDKYNEFRGTFENYLPEIEAYILKSLTHSELNLKDIIKQTKLMFDVIEIPYDNSRYDLVLICGKTYRKFFFLTRSINIRVEFKDSQIKSIQRKNDTTEENDE